MANQQIEFLFGRLNLTAPYQDNKKGYLLKALTSKRTVERADFVWGFFDVSELASDEGDFLHGFLVKYKRDRFQEVVDPNTHQVIEALVSNAIDAKSRFFLHVKTGIMAYHPVANKIDPKPFREKFREVFVAATDGFFVDIDIETIEDEHRIFEAIKQFASIERLDVSLHPSNPSSRDIWKRQDEKLQRMGAAKVKETYTAKRNNSLRVLEDEDLTAKMHMANDGYGRATVSGRTRDGERKKVSTSDNPVAAKASRDDADSGSVLKELVEPFRKLFSRLSK